MLGEGGVRLEVHRVTKRYPGVTALEHVSLRVLAGEVIGLIGENGAGKSTLMKVLGGLVTPDEGEVRWEGRAVDIRDAAASIALGIGFIHQELNDLDNLDVAGNMSLGREPTRGLLRLLDRPAMDAIARQGLARLGMDLDPRTPLAELSIAQRQMVEIAKALTLRTKLLIMDEPTSSLTLTETDRLLSVVEDLRRDGVSVLYISHRLGEIERIADRVVALRDGRNAGELSRDEIARPQMVSLMIGRAIAERPSAPAEGAARTSVVLRATDLRTPRYPHQPVSFELHAGEIVGLAGLVGAGRSEVACALFGVDVPSGGTVTVDGQRLRLGDPRAAIRAGVYLAPEDRRGTGLVTSMTVRENITLASLEEFATGTLVRGKDEAALAGRMATSLGVKTASIESQVADLSGGNQQKVVLAKWLSMSPCVVIFDEPTRGIDVGAKAEIHEQMRELARQGVAILAISSEMEEILAVSDRILVMHEGRLVGELDREAANEAAIMHLAIGGAA